MSRPKTTTEAVAEAPPTTTSEALTTQSAEETALAALAAAGIDLADKTGKDQIDDKNLILPFLGIAQKTSPQLEADTPQYIEGLQFCDLFDSITGQIYKQGPVTFIPLALREHAMVFKSWDEGGGILERDIPLDDDRCNFHGDEKPVATTFRDWIVLVLPTRKLMVLSFKGTSLRAGGVLKTLTKNPAVPLFAQQYRVTVKKQSENKNSWGVLVVNGAGVASPADAIYAKGILQIVAKKNIVIDHEGDAPERRDSVEGEVVGDDPIPY